MADPNNPQPIPISANYEFGKVNHDATLSPQWIQVLATIFTPMRYPNHVFQMLQAYLGQVAPPPTLPTALPYAILKRPESVQNSGPLHFRMDSQPQNRYHDQAGAQTS